MLLPQLVLKGLGLRRLILAVAGATLIAGLVLGFRDKSDCGHPGYGAYRWGVFWGILQDRAERWLVDHPDRACPRIDQLATIAERVKYNFGHVELTCSSGEWGRHVWSWTISPTPPLPHDIDYNDP
jgi:hypothetical protein